MPWDTQAHVHFISRSPARVLPVQSILVTPGPACASAPALQPKDPQVHPALFLAVSPGHPLYRVPQNPWPALLSAQSVLLGWPRCTVLRGPSLYPLHLQPAKEARCMQSPLGIVLCKSNPSRLGEVAASPNSQKQVQKVKQSEETEEYAQNKRIR